jgi:beta-glucosidase
MTRDETHPTQTLDPARTTDDVEAILDELTLREKAAQLAGTYVGTMGETRTAEDAKELIREHGSATAPRPTATPRRSSR